MFDILHRYIVIGLRVTFAHTRCSTALTLSLPERMMGSSNVILNFESADEILGVIIQMKPVQQYFHAVLFVILNISILKN